MGSTNSLDCKINGSKVKNYRKDEWDSKPKDLCRPGIHAKFQQNPDLFKILCEKTSTKTIVESANDRVWGTGTMLGNPDCLNRDKWINQGILGELLEEVRARQHHHPQHSVSVHPSTTTPTIPTAMEPIASKMLSIANYPQPHPPLQPPPPPFPEAGLYLPQMQSVSWPPGPPTNCNTYQYGYPQPRYPAVTMQTMQPVPPPIGTDITQQMQVPESSTQFHLHSEPKQVESQTRPENQGDEVMST